MQVPADMFVAKTRTAQECGGVNGSAGYHYGFAGDGNAMPTFRDGFDPRRAGGFNTNFLSTRFRYDPRMIFLCVGNPGFGYRLFGAYGAPDSAVATDFSLVAADHVARHSVNVPT